jgi:hypothetical protein
VPFSPTLFNELRDKLGQHVEIKVAVDEKGDARPSLLSWPLCAVRGEVGVMIGIFRGFEEIIFECRSERSQEFFVNFCAESFH